MPILPHDPALRQVRWCGSVLLNLLNLPRKRKPFQRIRITKKAPRGPGARPRWRAKARCERLGWVPRESDPTCLATPVYSPVLSPWEAGHPMRRNAIPRRAWKGHRTALIGPSRPGRPVQKRGTARLGVAGSWPPRTRHNGPSGAGGDTWRPDVPRKWR